MFRKFVLACFGVATALCALIAADRVAGALPGLEPRDSGIVFRPNSRMRHILSSEHALLRASLRDSPRARPYN